MQSVLECQVLANIIAVCDFIVYKVRIRCTLRALCDDNCAGLRFGVQG